MVGSAAMAQCLNAMVDATQLKPVIGSRFDFDQAPEAFAHASGPGRFGKTVITLDSGGVRFGAGQ